MQAGQTKTFKWWPTTNSVPILKKKTTNSVTSIYYRSLHATASMVEHTPLMCIYMCPKESHFTTRASNKFLDRINSCTLSFSLLTCRHCHNKMSSKVLLVSAVLIGLVALSSCRSLGELSAEKTYSSAPNCISSNPFFLSCMCIYICSSIWLQV